MYVRDFLFRNKNNLDLVRLLAAFAVIWGHAYALVPNAVQVDFVANWLKFTYSGALAVKLFFFLSGLVVTNSLLRGTPAVTFVLHRFFRLWPALFVTIICLSLLVGPLISTIAVREYFESEQTYLFIKSYLFSGLFTGNFEQTELPGVFSGNPYSAADGSLWTIPFEIGCYVGLLSLWLVFKKFRGAVSVALSLIITVSLYIPDFNVLPGSLEIKWAVLCFAMGSSVAFYQDKIFIKLSLVLSLVAIAFITRDTVVKELLFYPAFFASVLYLSSLKISLKFKLPGDYSYGVYLWGWPVQQILVSFVAIESIFINQAITILISLAIAVLSWHLIEKPSQNFSKVAAAKTNTLICYFQNKN